MSRLLTMPRFVRRESELSAGYLFAAGMIVLAVAAAILAGWAPLGFSIVTVFLFAGPHNWIEARYFLSRLPGRWGKLRNYFLLGFAGVFGLTATFALLPWLADFQSWTKSDYLGAVSLWNTLLIAWIATLVHWRSRQNPRRDWLWIWPVAFGLIGLNWLVPLAWSMALVYLHPLLALWILDREIARSRPEWRRAYHFGLCVVPLLLALLWWRLADAAPLPEGPLASRITNHAGAGIVPGVSSHLLVATHTFLEMLHYGVWLAAIPLVSLRSSPWNVATVPMARRSRRWRIALLGVVAVGAVVVLLLWGCFLADYPLTRDVYFTVAMLHVLAEVPFLLRALQPHEVAMNPAESWSFLLPGYVLSILIETPVLLAGLSPCHTMRQRLFAGCWLTACTYPIVILVLPFCFPSRSGYLWVAETFAPVAECALFWLVIGSRAPWTTRSMLRDFAVIVLANLASFGFGEVIISK